MPQFARLHQSRRDQGESIANIKEAIRGYVIALEEDGIAVPQRRLIRRS